MTSSSSVMTSPVGASSLASAAASTSSTTPCSTSQYLHPDYIQLMPSSMDAKNSPLALLAQTCSSIGRDPTPPPKSSNSSSSSSSADKKDALGSHHFHGKDSSGSEAGTGGGKSRPKSESPNTKRDSDDHRGSRSGRIRDQQGSRMSGSKGLSPPKSSGRTPLKDDRLSPGDCSGSVRTGCVKPTVAVSGSASVGSKGLQQTGLAGIPPGVLDLSSTDSLHRFAALQQQLSLAAAARSQLYPHHAALFAAASLEHGLAGSGGAPGSSVSTSSFAAAAAAAAASGLYSQMGCGGLPPGYPSLLGTHLDPLSAYASFQAPSLYAEYIARLKAAASTCKDPYCVRCQLAATFQLPPGVGGCGGAAQMAAGSGEKSMNGSSASLLQPQSSMLPPFLPPASLHALLQHLAAASAAAAAAAGTTATDFSSTSGTIAGSASLPPPPLYTCSWVDGASDFCGRRFSTSEELLVHLRTHASSSDPTPGSAATSGSSSSTVLPPALPAPQGFHPAMLAAAFSAFQSSVPGNQLSPSAGERPSASYSPSSLLSSSRFHPYKPPPSSIYSSAASVTSPPSIAGLPLPLSAGTSPGSAPQLFPSLAAYYSPYAALYGQRLGAAAAVGP